MRNVLTRVISSLIFAVALVAAQTPATPPPERVFDLARAQFVDVGAMMADAAKADVLFIGEQHDDPNTHRIELAILQDLAARRGDVVLAMEMFERDVQDPFDHFQMGHMDEAEFLSQSRPWPNYATDYKPLVDFALSKNWPIVASNVPRSIASDVSKSGLDSLKTKSAEDKRLFAQDLACPTDDDYFKRFGEAMGSHPVSGATGDDKVAAERAGMERFYFAQCLKDETMGESIARAYKTASLGGKHPLVVHVNGAFHSDFAEGTAARAQRRLPSSRIVVITVLPIADLDKAKPGPDDIKRANYLVYTVGKG